MFNGLTDRERAQMIKRRKYETQIFLLHPFLSMAKYYVKEYWWVFPPLIAGVFLLAFWLFMISV